jgi:hypothetical protein
MTRVDWIFRISKFGFRIFFLTFVNFVVNLSFVIGAVSWTAWCSRAKWE